MEHLQATVSFHRVYAIPAWTMRSIPALQDLFLGLPPQATHLQVPGVRTTMRPVQLLYEEDCHTRDIEAPPANRDRPCYRDYVYFRVIHRHPSRQLSTLPSRTLHLDRHSMAIVLCDTAELELDREARQVC